METTNSIMKIIFIRQAVPGGTDNYCKALCRMFADDAACQAKEITDYPVIHSRLFHYYYKPKQLKAAIADADIVHINGYTAFGTIQALHYAKRFRKKVIYSPHWHPFRHLRHPFLGKMFFQILKPFIKRCADTVVTINNEDTAFFRRFHRNVVQIPHWYAVKGDLETAEKKKNMILFVGRIDDPVKGIEHLYHLPDTGYEVHCVGRGELKRPDFHHHQDVSEEQLRELYRQASLVVIPSKYEAFSYVALEALLNGTPVLMSENVRIADYIGDIDGVSIFPYGNYDAFVAQVAQVIGGNVDMESVRQIFDPQTIKEQYVRIYTSV